MQILAGLRMGVPGLPCLNPVGPVVAEEVFGVGTVLRFSKSNATPSGAFNETMIAFLGTNDDEVALRVLAVGIAEDGVDGDGASPPSDADWWERGEGGIGG